MKEILSNKIKVIAIVGATASGKTSYSIELAKKIDGEIISADSRIIYKGFNIGAAKPTKEEMQGIPHYMIDIAEPTFDYSVGLYKKEAERIIKDITDRGKIPIVAGGTGLYTDILLKGFDLPDIKPDKQLRQRLAQLSSSELYDMLEKSDKKGAQDIDKNDKKKIIRAIEIVMLTGKTLEQARGYSKSPYAVEWIGKNFEREVLYQRINKRVDLMLEQGLVEETKGLIKKYGRAYNIINTIGYREITQYLDGILSLDESVELLKKNTRNYAKRQLTWFRKNPDIKWDVYPDKLKK